MTDTLDTNDAPLSMPPARFFFEIGFFAAHAEALVKNGTPPFIMSDALIDRAWDIARDASDNPREFDRYLSRADSADQRLAEGEAIYRSFDASNRDADGSPEGLAVCAKALRIYGAALFPATREGQAHFARVLMDAVASTIDAALAARPQQGRPITEACGIAMVEVLPKDRDELERGLITQGFSPERAKELAQTQAANDGALQMLARHRLAALASAPAGKLDRDYTRQRIKELIAEGDGFWHPCSGCQESCDGYVSDRDYPFDPLFRCQPGGGCSECGGIGVLWDDGRGYDDITGDEEPASAPAGAAEDIEWLSAQRRLSLAFYSPMYGDDDDQSEEWRVFKESGSINDREWDVIGRGATIAEAVAAARKAETDVGEVR